MLALRGEAKGDCIYCLRLLSPAEMVLATIKDNTDSLKGNITLLTSDLLLLVGATLTTALPYLGSPATRMQKILSLLDSALKKTLTSLDSAIHMIGQLIRSRESLTPSRGAMETEPAFLTLTTQYAPSSINSGNIANMCWSFTDCHTRIEAPRFCSHYPVNLAKQAAVRD